MAFEATLCVIICYSGMRNYNSQELFSLVVTFFHETSSFLPENDHRIEHYGITDWICRNCEEFASLLSYKWSQLTPFSDSLKESLHPYSFVKSSTDHLTSFKELESNLLGNDLWTYLDLLMRLFLNFLFCFVLRWKGLPLHRGLPESCPLLGKPKLLWSFKMLMFLEMYLLHPR